MGKFHDGTTVLPPVEAAVTKFPILDGRVQQLHHQDLWLLSLIFSWNHNCSMSS